MSDQEKTGTTLAKALAAALGNAGFLHELAPVSVLEGLHETMSGLREQGLLAPALYAEYESYLRFEPPPEVAQPRTAIVVARPSPAVKVRFELDSGPLEAVIPPTYISSEDRAQLLSVVRSVLRPAGFSVGRASGPVKLLAVRAGLARYGRNNLAYVKGAGSFVRLEALCTDADLGAVEYVNRGSDLMSCCPPCRNCHHVCPTGCIPHAGTVIDATRCLTHLNENEGEWPAWLDPAAHRCLVGCMRCQELCPANRYYLRKEKVVAEFDRAETEIVLQDLPPDALPESVKIKLEALDMVEYSPVLGRNLRSLAEAHSRRG